MSSDDYDLAGALVARFRAAAAVVGLTPGQVARVLWMAPEAWDALNLGPTIELLGDDAAHRMTTFVDLVENVAAIGDGEVGDWFSRLEVGEDLSPIGYIASHREALGALRDLTRAKLAMRVRR